WALKVGNGQNGGDANSVYFTAGIVDEKHGLFGSLTPVAPGTPEGPAEAQTVQIALDVFQTDLAQVQKDIAGHVTGAPLQQDIKTLKSSFIELKQAQQRFARETRSDFVRNPHKSATDNLIDAAVAAYFAVLGKNA